jgi:hypothetical protein
VFVIGTTIVMVSPGLIVALSAGPRTEGHENVTRGLL